MRVMSHERHYGSCHRQLDCMFNNLLGLTAKATSKLYITGPLWGGSTGYPGESPHKGPVIQ